MCQRQASGEHRGQGAIEVMAWKWVESEKMEGMRKQCGGIIVVGSFPRLNLFAVLAKVMKHSLFFLQQKGSIEVISSEDLNRSDAAAPHSLRCGMLQALWDSVKLS